MDLPDDWEESLQIDSSVAGGELVFGTAHSFIGGKKVRSLSISNSMSGQTRYKMGFVDGS